MLIASSCVLLLSSFVVSLDVLVYFFLIYFLWSTMVIMFLFFNGGASNILLVMFGFKSLGSFNQVYLFCYIFLLLTTPCSFSLLYKISSIYCIYSLGVVTILVWVLYSLREQFFFLKYLLSSLVVKDSLNWLRSV